MAKTKTKTVRHYLLIFQVPEHEDDHDYDYWPVTLDKQGKYYLEGEEYYLFEPMGYRLVDEHKNEIMGWMDRSLEGTPTYEEIATTQYAQLDAILTLIDAVERLPTDGLVE